MIICTILNGGEGGMCMVTPKHAASIVIAHICTSSLLPLQDYLGYLDLENQLLIELGLRIKDSPQEEDAV